MRKIRLFLFAALVVCAASIRQNAIAADMDALHSPKATKATVSSNLAAVNAELEAMMATDQKNRLLMEQSKDSAETAKLWAAQRGIDSANQTRLDEIVKMYGYPAKAKFSSEARHAAFLVIQHSTPEMMKQYEPELRVAMAKGEFPKSAYAMLDDRIRMNEGRPQRYGSQLQEDEKSGKLAFWKIEDEANVDKRRAEMGLEPLAEYAQRFENIDYVPYSGRASKPPANKVEAKK